MNTDIEFRGLRSDGKGWVYGFLLTDRDKELCYIAEGIGTCAIEVIPESVGQYHNSLSEKTKGKRVYVGDIISFDLKEGLGEPKTFNCTQVIETIEMSSFWYSNVRVVGNIHENK
ncbi:hypothetical protein [Paenimyroides ceti]